MGRYIVEDMKTGTYEKNFKFPLVNLIPAVIWSIPLHQRFFPDASWLVTFGLCAVFVVAYCALSYMPIIAIVPCIASAIIFTASVWILADYIGNDIGRIAVKVMIAGFFGFVELAVFANATVPWLEGKRGKKPRVYKVEE